jgi:hypothetical protein
MDTMRNFCNGWGLYCYWRFMIRFKPGKKPCAAPDCMVWFEKNPHQPFQKCCSIPCALKYNAAQEEKKILRGHRAEVKVLNEKIKTPADYRNDLQKVFNQWVKLRDAAQPCISCGTRKPTIRYDAGHYFSVGAHPNLRYHEDNVHKQCSFNCNNKKHGNQVEYGIRLVKRIGQERYDNLLALRNEPLQLSIPEIKEKIVYYRQKIKELKNAA